MSKKIEELREILELFRGWIIECDNDEKINIPEKIKRQREFINQALNQILAWHNKHHPKPEVPEELKIEHIYKLMLHPDHPYPVLTEKSAQDFIDKINEIIRYLKGRK